MTTHGTGRAYASDIQLILQKSKVSKDSRIKIPFILSRMADWRAKEIRDQWKRGENDDINPEWIQDMGICQFTQVGIGDDPAIPMSCENVGKFTIPQVVSIPNDRGVFRVSPASKYEKYYNIEIDRFFELEPGTIRSKFKYHFRAGTSLYTSPFKADLNVMLILLNPLDGYVIQTEIVQPDALIYKNDYRPGEVYKVEEGAIVHNNVQYTKGQTFTAVTPYYTGNGIVMFDKKKRKMTIDDPYPMSGDMATNIARRIWEVDFQLEAKAISDIINDAQDQLTVLQPK